MDNKMQANAFQKPEKASRSWTKMAIGIEEFSSKQLHKKALTGVISFAGHCATASFNGSSCA
jgi:hypothetical protein